MSTNASTAAAALAAPPAAVEPAAAAKPRYLKVPMATRIPALAKRIGAPPAVASAPCCDDSGHPEGVPWTTPRWSAVRGSAGPPHQPVIPGSTARPPRAGRLHRRASVPPPARGQRRTGDNQPHPSPTRPSASSAHAGLTELRSD